MSVRSPSGHRIHPPRVVFSTSGAANAVIPGSAPEDKPLKPPSSDSNAALGTPSPKAKEHGGDGRQLSRHGSWHLLSTRLKQPTGLP